jgi:RHS repeat-associated protein
MTSFLSKIFLSPVFRAIAAEAFSAGAIGFSSTFTSNKQPQPIHPNRHYYDHYRHHPHPPTYDDDGNTLTDGTGKIYTWDCENRLIQVTLQNATATTEIVRYYYDGISRRVKREHIIPTKTTTTTYLYDGWNVIFESTIKTEVVGNSSSSSTKIHLWGLDISPALQRSGGIAGLLSSKYIENGIGSISFCTFDAAGNLCNILLPTGEIGASYQYDATGKTIWIDGDHSENNFYRFSTKEIDTACELYYYGSRHYDSVNGRWLNRDIVGELGGDNIYSFVKNDGVNLWDYLGFTCGKIYSEMVINPISNPFPRQGFSWFSLSFSLGGGLKVEGEICEVCCADGSKASEKKVSISAFLSATASASVGPQFSFKFGKISVSGLLGIELTGSAAASASVTLTSGGCDEKNETVDIPIEFTLGVSVTGGGKIVAGKGWVEFTIGQATVSGGLSWGCEYVFTGCSTSGCSGSKWLGCNFAGGNANVTFCAFGLCYEKSLL